MLANCRDWRSSEKNNRLGLSRNSCRLRRRDLLTAVTSPQFPLLVISSGGPREGIKISGEEGRFRNLGLNTRWRLAWECRVILRRGTETGGC